MIGDPGKTVRNLCEVWIRGTDTVARVGPRSGEGLLSLDESAGSLDGKAEAGIEANILEPSFSRYFR